MIPTESLLFEPKLATTGVGSLPHRDPRAGVADVLAFCPEFPYWPQFPNRSPSEHMYRQFSAGLPGVRQVAGPAGPATPGGGPGDEPKLTWRRDEEALEGLERAYAGVLELAETGAVAGQVWGLGPGEACGLYALSTAMRERDAAADSSVAAPAAPEGRRVPSGVDELKGLKGQITGPVSLGLSVTGEGGRALLYEEDIMDGVARALALKARWQEDFLSDVIGGASCGPRASSGPAASSAAGAASVLISVDEPYLGTFGSAYFPYRPETVLSYLQAFDDALRGRWGVHCCANTDWEFILASPARFLSFDAYAYGDKVALYPGSIESFLGAGKTLAWGIVPTSSEALRSESEASLARRLASLFETLASRGVSETKLVRQSMITPSCGLAGLSVEESRRAMSLAASVSEALRREFGLHVC